MSELVPEDALCPGVVFLSLRKMRPCDREAAVSGENGSCPLSDRVGGTQDTIGDDLKFVLCQDFEAKV